MTAGRFIRYTAAACVLTVLGVVPPPAAGFAGINRPNATTQPTTQPNRLTIRLTGQTPVVGTDGVFDIRADVFDPAVRPDLDMAIAVYQRVTDRTALLDSIEGVRLGSPISLRVRPLGPSDQRGTYIVSERVLVGSCETCLAISTDGVYPVSIDIRERSEGAVSARLITHLILQRRATPTLSVALIIPTTVPRTLLPDGSHRTTPLTRLVAASESLASLRGLPLSIVPTPSIVARARDDVAVAGALDTLSTGLAGRELIASTFEAFHPQLQQDGRLGEVIRGQWLAGSDALTDRFGENVVTDTWMIGPMNRIPDRDGMLRIGPQRLVVHSSLVAETSPTGGGIRTMLVDKPVVFDTGLVFQSHSDGTLVQEETLEESSAIRAIVTDETLTGHLLQPDTLLGVNQLLADLALASERATPGAGLAVWVPDEAVKRLTIDALLAGIDALQSVTPARVSELFERPIATDAAGDLLSIGRVAVDATDTSDDYLAAIDAARRGIDGVNLTFGSNPAAGRAAERFFSAALADPDGGTTDRAGTEASITGGDYLTVASQLAARDLGGVRLARGGPFRLTALRGRIPVTVENVTGGAAVVHLSVEQGRVRSTPASAEQDVVVEAGSQVVLLDVETRSSGSFDVRVSLTTPNGVALSRNAYTIRSTGVSGIGVTLTLTLLGLLILWWLSNRAKNHGHPRRPQRRRSVEGSTEGSARDRSAGDTSAEPSPRNPTS